tara:strand:+ start:158 stop:427 length:270 start_codon:yes stop_codon:yes gene_type:complete
MGFGIRKKHSKIEVEDILHEICIEKIEEEYRILWRSDCDGLHIVIAFEKECPQLARELFSGIFMGWRLLKAIYPEGYLQVFFPLDKIDD